MHPPNGASVVAGFATLRSNPLRTTLSTLGVVIGAAALVAVLALGDGMERFVREQVARSTDVQSILIASRTSVTIDGQTFPVEDYPVFTPADAEALVAAIPGVDQATLTVGGRSAIEGAGGRIEGVGIAATLPSLASQVGLEFAVGRYFTPAEADSNSPVIVLSHTLARRLTGGRPVDALGDTVRIRGRDRRIVGVLAAVEGEQVGAAYIPIQGVGDALAPTPKPRAPTLVLRARTIEDVTPVQQAVERWLAVRHGDWKRVARVETNRKQLQDVERGMTLFRLFMGAITGISLIVGGIGIMNVLLASVTERTREIGVRKAVGASRGDILVQFLAESVTISGLGSALGAAAGLGGAFGITAVMRQQTDAEVYAAFTWSTVLICAVAALSVGLTFGLYPALRASRLSPIDAIRHE
jgi:putative ABC transport system permease protein